MKIGLYVNKLDEDYQLSIYRSIKKRTGELGLNLICIQQEHVNRALDSDSCLFPSRQFINADGVIILTPAITEYVPSDAFNKLRTLFPNIPVVSIGDHIEGICSIIIKSRSSMEQLMEHLVHHHNYRRFLYIGGPEKHRDNILRETVFRTYLSKMKNQYPEIYFDITHGFYNENTGTAVMTKYYEQHINNPPDVVVAANDEMAIGALKVLKTRTDIRWQNCAVTGFDDTERAQITIPPLTTIRQPFEEMGTTAVEAMYTMLKQRPSQELLKVDCRLHIRNSCGCSEIHAPYSEAETERMFDNARAELTRMQYQAIKVTRYMRNTSLFGEALNTVSSISDISDNLKEFLNYLEVQVFFLILFEKHSASIPLKGKLVYKKTHYEEIPLFNTPEQIKLKTFFSDYITPENTGAANFDMRYLRAGDDVYGLIVYTSDDSAHQHMCSASVYMANALQRLNILNLEKKRAEQLEKEVSRRTKDLVSANNKLKRESQRRIKVEAEVLKISELERMRFSLDLHDDICQRLAGISMKCRGLSSGNQKLLELSDQIDETLTRTRQYAHDSFPMDIDVLGINQAIDNLCHTFQKQTGCKCTYNWSAPEPLPISRAAQIAIFRIIQEAMHNTIKHAKANEVKVTIEKKDSLLWVTVSDNGKGIKNISSKNMRKETHGLGLRSMQYRADQIGAEYKLTSTEENGTRIQLKLHLLS
ncbi:MAG: substrate-binding domain-containing protein [Treponemataceae bacterium]|nr:substrate-binding domain-containing protein [Treponemataceae bacterium]